MDKYCLFTRVILLVLGLNFAIKLYADCGTPVNWSMNVKNNTRNAIKLCDGHVLEPGAPAYVVSGSTGCPCGCSASGVSCSFVDQVTQQTGSLKFVYNSCASIDAQTTSGAIKGLNPVEFAYACPATQLNSSDTRITYDCGYQQKYTTRTVSGYFDLVPGKDYQFSWSNISLTPAKGQVFADKLASRLKLSGKFYNSTALFKDNAVMVDLISEPPDPYDNVTSCSSVNDW